ncbi:helix-turn-helix domain-containing protein [Rubripirellula reticaptiva]|uniref:Helix-turn-helix domain protein n=1 Tax=Rubripirellula reticaptiva TaxID=2528013 RepID=A0A5C6EDD3_9BACT|nr:helix-turn-helix domain-containing protein [Rubripirellula reticaptiva]TWU46495.1 Helix-turn-helix domain protein [Rubripirellula reticaptiva]
MTKLSEFLTIKEAAEYLGVSQNTLRNWGRDGRIKERRHPVNQYRLYAEDELNQLLRQADRPCNEANPRKPKSK